MSLDIIALILGSNIVNTFTTWILSKKKYKTEVDSGVIKNMQDSLDFYKRLCDDTKDRLETVLKENSEFRKQVADLQAEMLGIYKFLGVQTKEELFQLKENLSK